MVIKKSSLPAAQSALRGLTPRPSDEVSELAAIKNLRRQIERALKIGYSLNEVAKTLAQYDIQLSASQLESGLAKLKKEDKKKSLSKVKAPALDTAQTEAKPAKVKKIAPPVAEIVDDPKSATPEPRTAKRAY
jgi:hypothetical protein